jgi:hypothetical protein
MELWATNWALLYCDMTAESRNMEKKRRPLLDNGEVNMFPRQAINTHQYVQKLWEAVFSIRPIPRPTYRPAQAVLSCIVTNQYQATTSEQIEYFMCLLVVVIYIA